MDSCQTIVNMINKCPKPKRVRSVMIAVTTAGNKCVCRWKKDYYTVIVEYDRGIGSWFLIIEFLGD